MKYLASPISTSYVNEDNAEFGCLFRTPCLRITPETIEQFVHTSKTFTKVSGFLKMLSIWLGIVFGARKQNVILVYWICVPKFYFMLHFTWPQVPFFQAVWGFIFGKWLAKISRLCLQCICLFEKKEKWALNFVVEEENTWKKSVRNDAIDQQLCFEKQEEIHVAIVKRLGLCKCILLRLARMV